MQLAARQLSTKKTTIDSKSETQLLNKNTSTESDIMNYKTCPGKRKKGGKDKIK